MTESSNFTDQSPELTFSDSEYEEEDLLLISLPKIIGSNVITDRSLTECETCEMFYGMISADYTIGHNKASYLLSLETLITEKYEIGGECKSCGNVVTVEDFDINTNTFVQEHKGQLTKFLHKITTRAELVGGVTASALFMGETAFNRDALIDQIENMNISQSNNETKRGRRRVHLLKTPEAIAANMVENRKNKFEAIQKLFAVNHKIPQDIVDISISDYINVVGNKIFRTNNRLMFIAALMYQECASLNCFKNVDLILDALKLDSVGLSRGKKILIETIERNRRDNPKIQEIYDRLFSPKVTENIMEVYVDTLIKALFIPSQSMTDSTTYYTAVRRAEVYKRILIKMFNYLTINHIYPTTTNSIKFGACVLFLVHETRGVQYSHEEYDRHNLSKNTIKKIYKDILVHYRPQFITILQLEQSNL